jgi:hypothetical protein
MTNENTKPPTDPTAAGPLHPAGSVPILTDIIIAKDNEIARLKDKIEILNGLLAETRGFHIGKEVPVGWFRRRDRAIPNPPWTTPNAIAQTPPDSGTKNHG